MSHTDLHSLYRLVVVMVCRLTGVQCTVSVLNMTHFPASEWLRGNLGKPGSPGQARPHSPLRSRTHHHHHHHHHTGKIWRIWPLAAPGGSGSPGHNMAINIQYGSSKYFINTQPDPSPSRPPHTQHVIFSFQSVK